MIKRCKEYDQQGNPIWEVISGKPAQGGAVKVIVSADSESGVIVGRDVPALTAEQLQTIYNEIVAGNSVVIESENEEYFAVKEAHSNDDVSTIYVDFEDSHILKYELTENEEVEITATKLGEGNVLSVNGKVGTVVLDATDIKLTTTQTTVQANIIRIDEEINRVENDLTEDIEAEATAREEADDALDERINNISSFGRELSGWNCATGKPKTDPTTDLPYEYRTGDYYIVETVASAGGTNYRPDGTEYDGTASTTVETDADIKPLDVYRFDGSQWYLIKRPQIDLTNYVDLSSTQTITGYKTFINPIKFYRTGYSSQVHWLESTGYGAAIYLRGLETTAVGFRFDNFYDSSDMKYAFYIATSSRTKWLGTATYPFNVAYIEKLISGNVEINVSQIATISMLADYETSSHASSTYATKTEVSNKQDKATTQTITTATYTGGLTSNINYVFSSAVTALSIQALEVTTGDEQPYWSLDFTAGTGIAVSFTPTITWVDGTPTFVAGSKYTITIKKVGTSFVATLLEY